MKQLSLTLAGGRELRFLTLLSTLLVVLMVPGCAVTDFKPEAFADFDRDTNFAPLRTFTWKGADPITITSPRPVAVETRQILMRQTVAELTAKGLTEVKTAVEADLLVSIVIGTRDDAQLNSYPARYGGGYNEVRETTQVGIGVELFDRKTDERLWTGWATTGLTMEIYANSDAVAEQLVVMILDQFPPQ